ncbi:hypothetical protein ACWOBW_06570 [Gemella sanguinis]
MKKISKIAIVVLVVAVLLVYIGSARKGSRTWIENKVSDIERVYPTENLEDLFEKFPNGFIISQTRLFEENGKSYSIDLVMKGDKDTKKITGKVSKVLLQSEPYREIVEKESEVEYKKEENLVLAKPELTEELLPKNYFLFQKLKLNKDILGKLKFENKDYTPGNGGYGITYKINDTVVNNYLGGKVNDATMRISGIERTTYNPYKHGVKILANNKGINYHELISEDKEDLTEERE